MDRIIREKECRTITGLARTTRWLLERRGLFPARRRITGHRVGWLESDLIAWLQSTPAGIGVHPDPAPVAQRPRAGRRPAKL